MNRRCFRLVFSRRLGMRVAVAECAGAARKAASGSRRAATVPLATAAACAAVLSGAHSPASAQTASRPPVVFANKLAAPKNNLPVANTNAARRFVYDPAKGSGSADLRQSGQVSWTIDGRQATFDQGKVERVVINWDSFDIGAGYKVHFKQDGDASKYVSALNRIWSQDPSVILGSLTADREVILLNANGVYFGRGARVETGSFVATANNIADAVFEKGIRNITDASAAFAASDGTDYQTTQLDAAVSVEAGAEIRSAAGGDVLLIAPRVVNQGRIVTPSGQTVLAAGDKVYLMSSSDPAQRGLIVAVDPVLNADGSVDTTLGTAENAATGSYKTVNGATVDDTTPDGTSGLVKQINEIRAESGTVNLVGLAVKQSGVVNATTAVKGANGAIYLQAMSSTQAIQTGLADSSSFPGRLGLKVDAGTSMRVGRDLGTVTFGAGSQTVVTPASSSATQIDAEVFNASRIRAEAKSIAVEQGALVQAAAGRIELLAASRMELGAPVFDLAPSSLPAADDGSRIVVAPDATLSVAGLRDVAVDGARNQGTQRLFRIELADSPVQRGSALYRAQVFFDLREADSIALADVSAAAATVARTAAERSTAGGTLRLDTLGTLVVGDQATLDVSGGSVQVSEATLRSSLVERGGRAISFAKAAASNRLDALLGQTASTPSPAYTEGRDGGTLLLSGSNVAVAGTLLGSTIEGQRQRAGTDVRATEARLTLGRSLNSGFLLPSVQLLPGDTTPLDAQIFVDPLTSTLSLPTAGTELSLATVQAGGFGALDILARSVTQPAQGQLDLGSRGSLAITAGSVALDGQFTAHGGSLSVRGLLGDVTLSDRTRLDASGLWTNDTAADSGTAADIQANGGTVTVSSPGRTTLGAGTVLDVSAGAALSGAGSLTRGTAGTLNLSASDVFGELTLGGAALRGFGFAGGGTLNLVSQALTIGNDAAGSPAGGLVLAPAFFSAGGFSSINVSAYGDIRIASGTLLQPQLLNWQLDGAYRSAASGGMNAAVASAARLDSQLVERRPVNLSLVANRPYVPDDTVQTGSTLSVERGASIVLDPGAKLTLAATVGLDIGARGGSAGQASILSAPGGDITLRLDGLRGVAPQTGGDPIGFLPGQALWLGADADLSVAGTAVLRPAAAALEGRETGTVYGGGNITLQASRGYVVAQAGSRMNLDGAAAAVDYTGLDRAVTVARSAGTLSVSTPEGFALEGTVSARAPVDAAGHKLADGGRLDLAVGAGGVATTTEATNRPYPGTVFDSKGVDIAGAVAMPRDLQLGGAEAARVADTAAPGTDLYALLGNGIGRASTALLTGSGFDGYRFASGDRVSFTQSLNLNAGLAIEFDTPAIAAAPGAQVVLGASYARLGDGMVATSGRTPLDITASADASAGHDTMLAVRAATIDVVGHSALKGFSSVTLDAASQGGEIRLMGSALSTALIGSTSVNGSLAFTGDLALRAAQVYAISGAGFTFNGLADASRFAVSGSGSVPATPLSAFGALTVNATDIAQDGVLRQPFGAITLNATNALRLGDGSLTSVSGDAATLLYGSTDNLSRWLLPATGLSATQVPLDKGITLKAAHLDAAAGARVDASGGGDVRAWEFFSGIGGSTDYLAQAGLWAVLPDYAGTRALSVDGGRIAGSAAGQEFVVTQAGSGLAPGRYTLMPARQALLGGTLPQGAFIVSRASDQGKSVLASALSQDDGSTVVTGYLSHAGSVATGTPGERFVVEPMATFLARSEYRLTGISSFLDSQTAGAGARGTPNDGGRVQVAMSGSGSSQWRAALALGADEGRAGTLDISATQLAVVDDLARAPSGALGVDAAVVNASGAGSVLLGGLRSNSTGSTGTVTKIDTSATSGVTLDLGALSLEVEELILGSSGTLSLGAGTTLLANRPASLGSRTLSVSGGGALAVVSANAVEVQRSDAVLGSGSLDIGAGSRLSGARLVLDTAGRLEVADSAALNTQVLALGANRLVIGQATEIDAQSTVVTGGLLAASRQARDLALRSYTSIDFAGRQDWTGRNGVLDAEVASGAVVHSLLLDAPAVRGVAGADGSTAAVDIAAQVIALRNSTGLVAAATETGSGTLSLLALPPLAYGSTGGLSAGPGQLWLGFADSRLTSRGDIVLQGSGGTLAQGDLTLAAARITAASGASQQVQAANGTLRLDTLAGSRSLGERVGQGAQVTLSGARIEQAGRLDLPGGLLDLQATGTAAGDGIVFGAGSSTSVAGYVMPGHDGFEAHGLAGTVSATAAAGNIAVAGLIDVSAALRSDGSRGSGDAGQVSLSATGSGATVTLDGGRIAGHAGSAAQDRGGRLLMDVAALPSLDGIASAAASGGIDREIAVRVRSGDTALNTGLRAERLTLSADAGQLSIGAVIVDAHAATGGVVQLHASGDLTLAAGAAIDARSTRAGANGGDVLLDATAGRLRIDAAATVDTRGDDDQDGRIVLRALRSGSNAVAIDALNTASLQGAEVDIEAVRVYRNVTSGSTTARITSIGNAGSSVSGSGANATATLGQTAINTDNNAYMANAATVLSSLGVGGTDSGRVRLRAGVEVRADGDLTVASDWALNAWRPGGEAGFLTLRASGNLTLSGSLSDGFAGVAGTAALLGSTTPSWSMRLVSGADLGAADLLATRDLSAGSTETGNLSIAAGKLVRTGAGSIEMAAGRDVRFGGSGTTAATAYVAGRRIDEESAVLDGLFSGQTPLPSFTEHGGRLSVAAARDITSSEATQMVTNWLWRSGQVSTDAADAGQYSMASHLAWWSEFTRWRQTLGSMGGGDLTLSAGRNIENVQAMVPTSAWADSRVPEQARLQVNNGGDLDVQAAGSVLGGQFLVGRGEGRLTAGGSVAARTANSRVDAPVLALADGDWRVAARDSVALAAVFNPTAMNAPTADNRAAASGFYYTWTGTESLDVRAAAGGVSLLAGIAGSELNGFALAGDVPRLLARVLPASLAVTAGGGSIELSGLSAMLFPSTDGHLSLWSGANILMGSERAVGQTLAMGDSDLSLWPSVTRPIASNALSTMTGAAGLIPTTLSGDLASAVLHQNDDTPVDIHAEGTMRNGTLRLAKAARLSTGLDWLDMSLSGLNVQTGDTTSLNVGRDLLQSLTGSLITVAGPGLLEVTAGRDIDLGSSKGITTTGNVSAPSLPASGSSIRVAAATAGTLDLTAFEQAYLGSSANPRAASHRALLLAYVRESLDQPALGYDEAWALFKAFPAKAQAALGQRVLAAEFGAVYLSGDAPTAASLSATLQAAFDRHKAEILAAGEAALAASGSLELPGREVLQGPALQTYLQELRALSFGGVDIDAAVKSRVASLASARAGWREAVAARLGSTVAALEALAASHAADPLAQAWTSALLDTTSPDFQRYRQNVLASEMASVGANASLYGRKTLPMRLALFDQGFQVAELAGAGSFVAQPIWSDPGTAFGYTGALDITQSSVVSERGGDIALVNGGGAINVGLKASKSTSAKGVIARGGGNIFGLSKNDFQVNTQRVFIVGSGNMTIWSSEGDIDSGRGANTAVAAPPLEARRTANGVTFETPATTTGSGLGILEDASGRREGTIGLYPAFGEILALDAFIRAPSIVLGATVRGADNIQSPSVGGAAAPVSAPVLSVTPPPPTETRAADTAAAQQTAESRPRSSLLTIDLLGLGAVDGEAETCTDEQRRAGRCPAPAAAPASTPATTPAPADGRPCTPTDRAAGRCK